MSKCVGLVLVFVFLAACMFVTMPAPASAEETENTWVSKAPMQVARSGLGAAVVNGKIYAIGGSTQSGGGGNQRNPLPHSGEIVGANEEYDPTTDTWTLKTSMPTPRAYFVIAVCQNSVYCIGGGTKLNEVYDPATDTWETKAPMPTSRNDFAMAVFQNKIYCIGGYTSTGFTEVNEVYDPATDTWETKAPMLTAKVAEANVVNGKIFLIGGNPNNTLNQVYDPVADSWAIKTSIPTEAVGASAVVNNKIYFVSYSYSGGQFTVLNQIYDPEIDMWIQGASPPVGGVKRGALILTTGKMAPKQIYILDDALRVYNPATDTWAFGANMSTSRVNFAVAVVDDVLYAVGGNIYTYSDALHSLDEIPAITPYAANEQYIPFGYGIVPSVVSPETNRTYVGSDVPLTFALEKTASWMGYSLDGQATIAIAGNTTITGLAGGLHNVTVYAKDQFENTGVSETITFTVAKPEPFPTTPVVASAVTAVAISAGILVYFKKRRR